MGQALAEHDPGECLVHIAYQVLDLLSHLDDYVWVGEIYIWVLQTLYQSFAKK